MLTIISAFGAYFLMLKDFMFIPTDVIGEWLNASFPWFLVRLQPRDTCYIASSGLPELGYSGYQPHAYSWDDFPPLKDILEAVRMFNSSFLIIFPE